MSVPGMNLLNMSLTIILRQTIQYYKLLSRPLNIVGQNVDVYAAPVNIVGSFQPVPRMMYEQYGLDLQKTYYNFYTSNNLLDLERDFSADKIVYQGVTYKCESNTEWYGEDGWKGILCVQTDTTQTFSPIFGFNQDVPVNSYTNFNNGGFVNAG
jgi:hypothetical protein